MTTALEGVEVSASCPGHSLHPGKPWYPLYRRLGGPQGRWTGAENLAQPIASHYIDWATRSMCAIAYTYQNLQLVTCCSQLQCPYQNTLVFLDSTSAHLLFCSLDVTVAQNLCENRTNKLIGSTLLPYQCFFQILPSYSCYNVCVVFLVFC
jgi:hypothetical protein